HARETRQASIDVARDLLGRGPPLLEHLLDQIDPPARTIELVAEQHVGRARRRAEAAVHALAQDLLGFSEIRIGEPIRIETRLQGASPFRPWGADRNAPFVPG